MGGAFNMSNSNIIKAEEINNSFIFNGSPITDNTLNKIADSGRNLLYDMVTNDCAIVSDFGIFGDKAAILDSVCRLCVEIGAITKLQGITKEELAAGISNALNDVYNELQQMDGDSNTKTA